MNSSEMAIEDDRQYLLVNSRECTHLVGYRRDSKWYVNGETGDYELSFPPDSVVLLEAVDREMLTEKHLQADTEDYQLVQLPNGRCQVAYLCSTTIGRGRWFVDVLGSYQIRPVRVFGLVTDWDHFSPMIMVRSTSSQQQSKL
mgnify:CR=1 FL=1